MQDLRGLIAPNHEERSTMCSDIGTLLYDLNSIVKPLKPPKDRALYASFMNPGNKGRPYMAISSGRLSKSFGPLDIFCGLEGHQRRVSLKPSPPAKASLHKPPTGHQKARHPRCMSVSLSSMCVSSDLHPPGGSKASRRLLCNPPWAPMSASPRLPRSTSPVGRGVGA